MSRFIWLALFVLAAGIALTGCGGGGTHLVIIIDEDDSGVTIIAGTWDSSGGGYDGDFLYHYADRVNVGVVRYTPNIETAGSYRVDIWWPSGEDRTTDQPVIVHDADGDTTYHVNLQQNGHQWFTLGSHTFSAGTGGYIDFTTDTDAGYCNADAVRLTSEFTVD